MHCRPGNDCDPRANAVGLVCQKPTYAVCPGVSEPHGDSCYDVYAHPDDRADFEAAQRVCQENGGGHLVQVRKMSEGLLHDNNVGKWQEFYNM